MEHDDIVLMMGRLEAQNHAQNQVLHEVKDDLKTVKDIVSKTSRRVDRLEIRSGIAGILGGSLTLAGYKIRAWLGF